MQLHAKVTSNGPDVLLVHGVTDNLHTWDRITPALATRARVHAVDLPGHGGSPIPDRPLRMAEMARALSDYLDEADITRCVVVGNSVGGGVSLMLAASEPDRVRGVVTLGSVGLPSSGAGSATSSARIWRRMYRGRSRARQPEKYPSTCARGMA